jgi:glycosyltransferase involved in cell wall biosynthesis
MHLSARSPAVRAAVVGEGPLEKSLRAQTEDSGVGDAIDFLGFREDVEAIYADSVVYVQTSRYEALSIALIEAMAAGVPVVASDVGETRALVRDGANGYVVPVGDVEAIASRVDSLLGDDLLRKRFGDAAARDAREHAGYRNVAGLYRQVLMAAPTPTRR